MNKLLTNAQQGYDIKSAPDSNVNTELFRIMSVMAVSEQEQINIVSPSVPARVMKHNPERLDDQIYLATIRFYGLDHSEERAIFSIIQSYVDLSVSDIDYMFCDLFVSDKMSLAEVDGGYVYLYGDVYEYFAMSVSRGTINIEDNIEAHIYTNNGVGENIVDYYLDWSGMAKSSPVSESVYSDISARVKNGDKRDSCSTWREMHPTGIDVGYSSITGRTSINVDTGIIFSSHMSSRAPLYIDIAMTSLNETDYTIRMYFNIDSMPYPLFPSYQMHPGQYYYTDDTFEITDAAYVEAGSLTMVKVASNVSREIAAGDSIIVSKGESSDACVVVSCVYSGGVTTIEVDVNIAAATGYSVHNNTDYVDGRLFGGDSISEYRTPMIAKMGIIRGTIVINNVISPLGYGGICPPLTTTIEYVDDDAVITLTPNEEIDRVYYTIDGEDPEAEIDTLQEATIVLSSQYKYREGKYDSVHGTYALSSYDVELNAREYTETGDIDNDSISSMRYIGHYGRNNLYAHTNIQPTSINIGIPCMSILERSIVSVTDENPYPIVSSLNTITVDVERAISRGISEVEYELVNGYYYKQMSLPQRQAVSNIMLSKIYIVPELLAASSSIVAVKGHGGYELLSLKEEAVGAILSNIGYQDEPFCFDMEGEPTAVLDDTVISIGSEMMIANSSSGSATIEVTERAYNGTQSSNHSSGDLVYVSDEKFYNGYIGVVESITDLSLVVGVGVPVGTPSSGCVMIGREILQYTSITGNKTITISKRAVYGSTQHTIVAGDHVYYMSYFTIDDIRPNIKRSCEYNDKYTPRLSLPMHYDNDPVRFGAKAVYLMEVRYETGQKNKIW